MDEKSRDLLAQAVRDALTLSGIDHDEEHVESLISQVDKDVLQAHLATAEGNAADSRLRISSSASQTPPASPQRTRGSYRLLQTQKKNYAKLGVVTKRKIRKQKNVQRSEKSDNNSTTAQKAGMNTARACSENQELSDNHTNSPRTGLPGGPSSSYHLESAFTEKAMASILYECLTVKSAIARYGHQTNMPPTRTYPSKIRKYVDELAEYDYDKAVKIVQKDNTLAVGRGVQTRCNETIFWKIILKGAALIDQTTLPPARGPADGFTMAEKAATKKFMEAAGYGLGPENQRQCRIYWKNLYKMREAGIEKFLYYRTKEFDSYCRGYPKTAEVSLVDTVTLWENQYRPFIDQLESRALRLGQGDLARLCDLEPSQITERLQVPKSSWNNGGNVWASVMENESFQDKFQHSLPAEIALESNNNQFLVSEFERDKSPFIFLVPQDNMALSVCSIVPLSEGDFLGIFAGNVRFSEAFNVERGICSPIDNLWLDYSQVTGTLNQVKASEPGGPSNVCLQWEIVHDDLGTDHCTPWRVSVRATKPVKPFSPLIRMAPRQEQYTLHLSLENARRGFVKHDGEV
ncbi:hypothetical protein N7451_012639 [Penicillium sp. IBT 35674x]|nr:hypothetical protein N7451_012639 [Penicillium sp. IBT 35674x]